MKPKISGDVCSRFPGPNELYSLKTPFCPLDQSHTSDPTIQRPLQSDPHFISLDKLLCFGGKIWVSNWFELWKGKDIVWLYVDKERSHGWTSQESKKIRVTLASWAEQEMWHSLTSGRESYTKGSSSNPPAWSCHDRGSGIRDHCYYDSACPSCLVSAACVFTSTLQPPTDFPMQFKSPEKQP